TFNKEKNELKFKFPQIGEYVLKYKEKILYKYNVLLKTFIFNNNKEKNCYFIKRDKLKKYELMIVSPNKKPDFEELMVIVKFNNNIRQIKRKNEWSCYKNKYYIRILLSDILNENNLGGKYTIYLEKDGKLISPYNEILIVDEYKIPSELSFGEKINLPSLEKSCFLEFSPENQLVNLMEFKSEKLYKPIKLNFAENREIEVIHSYGFIPGQIYKVNLRKNSHSLEIGRVKIKSNPISIYNMEEQNCYKINFDALLKVLTYGYSILLDKNFVESFSKLPNREDSSDYNEFLNEFDSFSYINFDKILENISKNEKLIFLTPSKIFYHKLINKLVEMRYKNKIDRIAFFPYPTPYNTNSLVPDYTQKIKDFYPLVIIPCDECNSSNHYFSFYYKEGENFQKGCENRNCRQYIEVKKSLKYYPIFLKTIIKCPNGCKGYVIPTIKDKKEIWICEYCNIEIENIHFTIKNQSALNSNLIIINSDLFSFLNKNERFKLIGNMKICPTCNFRIFRYFDFLPNEENEKLNEINCFLNYINENFPKEIDKIDNKIKKLKKNLNKLKFEQIHGQNEKNNSKVNKKNLSSNFLHKISNPQPVNNSEKLELDNLTSKKEKEIFISQNIKDKNGFLNKLLENIILFFINLKKFIKKLSFKKFRKIEHQNNNSFEAKIINISENENNKNEKNNERSQFLNEFDSEFIHREIEQTEFNKKIDIINQTNNPMLNEIKNELKNLKENKKDLVAKWLETIQNYFFDKYPFEVSMEDIDGFLRLLKNLDIINNEYKGKKKQLIHSPFTHCPKCNNPLINKNIENFKIILFDLWGFNFLKENRNPYFTLIYSENLKNIINEFKNSKNIFIFRGMLNGD
ncbi:MAG: hypothetical protein ACTSRZ_09190, partial [Promethearchaeota archaeon]